jgi:hypothetical protein
MKILIKLGVLLLIAVLYTLFCMLIGKFIGLQDEDDNEP